MDADRTRAHYYLALLSLPGVGRKTAVTLMCGVDSSASGLDAFLGLVLSQKTKHRRLRDFTSDHLVRAFEQARRQIDAADRLDLAVVPYGGTRYPSRLQRVNDPPAVLFVRSAAPSMLESPSIAIIGTRKPSEMARQVGRDLTTQVVRAGFAVVSGLAEGCDTIAHEACLDVGGGTIAVLGHGLDSIYPSSNAHLAQRIVEHHGALVSEYPPGIGVSKRTLVERDRIQSGLSCAVLVLETGVKGGALHAVRDAVKEDRAVATYQPPTALASQSSLQGNLELLRDKLAYPIRDGADLAAFLMRARQGTRTTDPVAARYPTGAPDGAAFAVRDEDQKRQLRLDLGLSERDPK